MLIDFPDAWEKSMTLTMMMRKDRYTFLKWKLKEGKMKLFIKVKLSVQFIGYFCDCCWMSTFPGNKSLAYT